MPRVKLSVDGLTPKERNFVKAITKGKNATEAALMSYNIKKKVTATQMGSDIMKRERVRSAIKKALQASGLDINQIAVNLHALAVGTPDKLSSETVLKANVEALKLMGAYPDKQSVHLGLETKIESKSYEEAQQELAKLREKYNLFMEEAQ